MSQVITFEDYTPPQRSDGNPWTQARIDEAAASTGPWTTIDTVDLDPIDTDPSSPAAQSFTTENGTGDGLWYRVVFFDGDGDASSPTDPVQNTSVQASAFATASELGARLGITLTDDEEDRAAILLALASGLIRRATRQTITLVTDDVLTIRGLYSNRITLPQRPVIEVTDITQNSVALADGSWYLDGDELVRGNAVSGFWHGGWSYWGCPADTFVITYTHGYADPPDEVKATVLEMVTRVWVNPAVTTRETNGSSDVMYAPTNGMLLTDAERRAVNDALRRQAASIALR